MTSLRRVKLRRDRVQRGRYGSYYAGVSLASNLKANYSFIYFIRRFILAVVIVFMRDQPVLQLIVILITSAFIIGYLLHVKPYKNENQNYIEIANESSLLMLTYFYSAFISDTLNPSTRMKAGMIIISLFIIYVVIQLCLTAYEVWPVLQRIFVKFLESS